MLISYTRPPDIAWSLIGADAAWLSTDAGSALTNGRPAAASRMQWISGAQTTASELVLRASWTAPLVPRVLGLVGVTLPVGTLITLTLQRPADGGYTYLAGTLQQRVVQLPDGSRCAWFVLDAGLDACTGAEFHLVNDVNGTAAIAAGAVIDIGEAWIGPAVEIPHEKDWTRSYNDATTVRRSKGGQPFTAWQRGWRKLQVTFAQAELASVRAGGLANGMAWERLEHAVVAGAISVAIPRFDSTDEVQRTAVLGTASVDGIRHLAGPLYTGSASFAEAPAKAAS